MQLLQFEFQRPKIQQKINAVASVHAFNKYCDSNKTNQTWKVFANAMLKNKTAITIIFNQEVRQKLVHVRDLA